MNEQSQLPLQQWRCTIVDSDHITPYTLVVLLLYDVTQEHRRQLQQARSTVLQTQLKQLLKSHTHVGT
jgi:hypothetical protein